MTTRRKFLEGIGAMGLASIGTLPPAFLARAAWADKASRRGADDGRVLVLIEMAGGNDGLNTVIPYADPEYAKNRPGIAIPRGQVRKIDDHHGLHPRMRGMQELFDEGALAVVQGVGYPNPNRSHFRSMDIWHSARPDDEWTQDGWLGRALDGLAPDVLARSVPAMSLGRRKLPLALLSSRVNVPNIQDLSRYRLELGSGPKVDRKRRRELMGEFAELETPAADTELAFLRATAATAYASADKLQALATSYRPAAPYPNSALGAKLKLIARIIAGDFGTRIFFVSLGGFDTHSRQEGAHAALLGELSDALRAFHQDMKGHKLDDQVMTATFSEFGRRVKENGSLGTDHGAASQLFLVTPTGKAGIVGAHPSLTDLERGDLRFRTDFRSVYATLLEDWLAIPSQPVLGADFPKLDLT